MSRALHLLLPQVPSEKRSYNHDRSLVLGWWVARHDEDRYDETTEYRIALFDTQTEEELTFFVTSVHERADTGQKDGEFLDSAAFDPDDEITIVLRFAGGSETRHRLDETYKALERNPEEFGVVVSDAEKRIREELRQDFEKLNAKLAGKLKRKP